MARLSKADESPAERSIHRPKGRPTFDARTFLLSAGVATRLSTFKGNEVIYAQGDRAESLMYIQAGTVQLSVLSKAGRRAIICLLGPGDFFGEGCLIEQSLRTGSACAVTSSSILAVAKDAMLTLLRSENAMSTRLIADLLARNHRIEEDLIDQMLNPAEQRLLRKLTLLTAGDQRTGNGHEPPSFSQEALADMIGTTRSRVNFFLKKFERLGLVSYTPGLTVNDTILRVTLRR